MGPLRKIDLCKKMLKLLRIRIFNKLSMKVENENAIRIAFSHLAQVALVVAKIKFLTNFFSIGAYAQYALFLSSMSVSVALSSGGIDFLLTKKLVRAAPSSDYFIRYLSRLFAIVLIVLIVSALLQLFLFFVLPPVEQASVFVLLGMLVFLAMMSINAALLAVYKGINEIGAYAKAYFWGNALNSLTQCLLVWSLRDSGVLAVIVGGAIVQALVQLWLISYAARKKDISVSLKLVFPRFSYIKAGVAIASAKSYTAGIGMAGQFCLLYGLLTISGEQSVAEFYLYNGAISQISNVILIAVSGSFFSNLLRAKIMGNDYMRDAIFSQSAFIAKVLFPILFTAVLFQDQFITLISSASFTGNNSLFDYMACAVFLAVLKQSFDLSIQSYEANKYFISSASAGAVTLVSLPCIFLYFTGINGFGVGLFIHSCIWLIAIPIISSWLYHFSLLNKYFLEYLGIAIVFVLLVLNRDFLHPNIAYAVIFISILVALHELFKRERI